MFAIYKVYREIHCFSLLSGSKVTFTEIWACHHFYILLRKILHLKRYRAPVPCRCWKNLCPSPWTKLVPFWVSHVLMMIIPPSMSGVEFTNSELMINPWVANGLMILSRWPKGTFPWLRTNSWNSCRADRTENFCSSWQAWERAGFSYEKRSLPPTEIIYWLARFRSLLTFLESYKRRMIWYTRLSVAPRLDKQYYFSPCNFTISRLQDNQMRKDTRRGKYKGFHEVHQNAKDPLPKLLNIKKVIYE